MNASGDRAAATRGNGRLLGRAHPFVAVAAVAASATASTLAVVGGFYLDSRSWVADHALLFVVAAVALQPVVAFVLGWPSALLLAVPVAAALPKGSDCAEGIVCFPFALMVGLFTAFVGGALTVLGALVRENVEHRRFLRSARPATRFRL
jgi:hypothetical protein